VYKVDVLMNEVLLCNMKYLKNVGLVCTKQNNSFKKPQGKITTMIHRHR